MTRKIQNKNRVDDRIIYTAKTSNGWSIVIMPDNIVIDNYHINKVHIHPNPSNHEYKVELSIDNPNTIEEIIKNYIHFCEKFDIDELLEMLK